MKTYSLLLLSLAFVACNEQDPASNTTPTDVGDWSVPFNEIRDGGPGRDGIPSIDNPQFITDLSNATFMEASDLVIGFKDGDDVRAYPLPILYWHEIVNDVVNNKPVTIIYCPLTGTSSSWDRTIDGVVTTFGVSGLLYNANVIPYDRTSNSNWIQLGIECINGEQIGAIPSTLQIMETTWETWKTMYPQTKVLSVSTGFDRDYSTYPYGDYKTSAGLIFGIKEVDQRLHPKERVHGVIIDDEVKVYRLEHFADASKLVINDTFSGQPLVVVGSQSQNFILSFYSKQINGELLTFSAPPAEYMNDGNFNSNIVMTDQFGNLWDAFGEAVSGPDQGEKLTPTVAMISFWFPWASFYADPLIYNE